MIKIELEIFGLSYSHSQSSAYALILGEKNGKRRLPIIVGGLEAQAIAIEVEKMKPARPLTHDLFKAFADNFNVDVKEIIINRFHEGIFYSVLICDDGKQQVEIDSRTSDAVAIALRFSCPIYTYEQVMAVAGVIMEDENEKKSKTDKDEEGNELDNEFAKSSVKNLEEKLQKAIEKEDYERASVIRDEINNRENK